MRLNEFLIHVMISPQLVISPFADEIESEPDEVIFHFAILSSI